MNRELENNELIKAINFWTVDVFSNKFFSGNPACVVFLDQWIEEKHMQNIAMEINLSETIFILKNSNNYFQVKGFTPSKETIFCGHSVFAAAHVMWSQNILPGKDINRELYFDSKNGVLKIWKEKDLLALDLQAVHVTPLTTPVGLIEALGCTPIFVGQAGETCFVELDNPEAIFYLDPDVSRLSNLDFTEIIVTANGNSDDPFDVVSRCFFPKLGHLEDHVSVYSHTKIGPYWKRRLKKNTLKAFQASKREGWIDLDVSDDRVVLKGKAVTVSEGKIFLDNLI